MSTELFDVVQFFPDGGYEKTFEALPLEEAVSAAARLCSSVGARIGTTQRVIITDSEDCTVFEWRFRIGVTFPPEAEGMQAPAQPV